MSVDVGGQAVIVQQVSGVAADNQVIADLTVKLARLESAVADAEESAEIAALSEQLAVAQAAIEQAGSLEGRLKTLEAEREALSAQARELAQQRADLENALTRLTAGDQAIQALTEQLNTLRGQVAAAEEGAEIEALHQQIVGLLQDLAAAQAAAAAAEESAEIATLQAKINELETLSAKQAEQSAEIAKLREMMGLPKREKIHLTQSMWSDGGYTWLKANFANTYKDPKVYLTVEHAALSASFLVWNFGGKTDTSVFIRSNFNKAQIDVGYSVYLYVEEWG